MLPRTLIAAARTQTEKLAGVELSIAGYHQDPELTPEEKKKREAWEEEFSKALQALGPRPKREDFRTRTSLLQKLRLKKPTFDQSAFHQAVQRRTDALNPQWNTMPPDDWDKREQSRVRTSRGTQVGSKWLSTNISSMDPKWLEHTTDQAYGDKPVVKNMNAAALRRFAQDYEKTFPKGTKDHDPELVQHIGELLKNKKAKFYRMEWH